MPMREEDVQQLAEQFAHRCASVSDWPDWMQVPALGHDITPVVARVLREALRSGLVVAASDVRDLAQQWEDDTTETWFQPEASEYAESLRALTKQEEA